MYFNEYRIGKFFYLLFYVDDMLVACDDVNKIKSTKKLLISEFDMKELGEAKKILGIEISRNRGQGTLKLTQSSYVKKVLNNFKIMDFKLVKTPFAQHFKLSAQDSLGLRKKRTI